MATAKIEEIPLPLFITNKDGEEVQMSVCQEKKKDKKPNHVRLDNKEQQARRYMKTVFDKEKVLAVCGDGNQKYIICNVCSVRLSGPLKKQIPTHMWNQAHLKKLTETGRNRLTPPRFLNEYKLSDLHRSCRGLVDTNVAPTNKSQQGRYFSSHLTQSSQSWAPATPLPVVPERPKRPWRGDRTWKPRWPLNKQSKKQNTAAKNKKKKVDRLLAKCSFKKFVQPSVGREEETMQHKFPSSLSENLQNRIDEKCTSSGHRNVDYRCLEIVTKKQQSRLDCAVCMESIPVSTIEEHFDSFQHTKAWMKVELMKRSMGHIHRRMLISSRKRYLPPDTPSPIVTDDKPIVLTSDQIQPDDTDAHFNSMVTDFFNYTRALRDSFTKRLEADLADTITHVESKMMSILEENNISVDEQCKKEIESDRAFYAAPQDYTICEKSLNSKLSKKKRGQLLMGQPETQVKKLESSATEPDQRSSSPHVHSASKLEDNEEGCSIELNTKDEEKDLSLSQTVRARSQSPMIQIKDSENIPEDSHSTQLTMPEDSHSTQLTMAEDNHSTQLTMAEDNHSTQLTMPEVEPIKNTTTADAETAGGTIETEILSMNMTVTPEMVEREPSKDVVMVCLDSKEETPSVEVTEIPQTASQSYGAKDEHINIDMTDISVDHDNTTIPALGEPSPVENKPIEETEMKETSMEIESLLEEKITSYQPSEYGSVENDSSDTDIIEFKSPEENLLESAEPKVEEK